MSTEFATLTQVRTAWIAYQADGGKLTYREFAANLGFAV